MDRRSTQRLKLDKRLIRRRGWIATDELERELEALPDVSDKVAPPEPEEPAAARAETDTEPQTPQ